MKDTQYGASYRRQWRKVHLGIDAETLDIRAIEVTTNAIGDARNEALRATKRLGRAIWKKWRGYHRRSLVEIKMHCFKLLSQRVVARTFDRQITEFKVRAAILNHFSEMGNPITVRIA